MNYGRKPGELKGEWYVGDSSSIALAVLATAVRCPDAPEKTRLFNSVSAYAKLVMENYVRPGGGITDGLWSEFDGEWWCSTGIFGSLAFVLYEQTGDRACSEGGPGGRRLVESAAVREFPAHRLSRGRAFRADVRLRGLLGRDAAP